MRNIFIGDIQGCVDEFKALLGRLRTDYGDEFHLWIAGDAVNRGPYNLKVLELIQRLTDDGCAQMVLGNHDLTLLSIAFGHFPLRDKDTLGDVVESAELDDWLEWIRRRPLVIFTQLGEQQAVVAHASVPPRWSVEHLRVETAKLEQRLGGGSLDEASTFLAGSQEEDPLRDLLGRLTRCRSVTADGGWSNEEPANGSEAWHAAWSRQGHDYGVVYGHWAMQGLHVAQGLRGLDTGCVHHGRDSDGFLTAWVPNPVKLRPFDLPDEDFVQERARRKYWRD
ncbi:MAG: metallophosphoesterase [Deltaproteobacteria bacterium]|nr:metallophosphoesterase [Deltaproteobacteria bacterium]